MFCYMYAMSCILEFQRENSLLVSNYNIEDLGIDDNLKLYAEFSEDCDGELARETVQTWICDNRLEVTNCIRIALDNCKLSFCNWYRASEQFSSPDKLILYCLARQTRKHVCIFNAKYVWSTLAQHIKYDYSEVLKHSSVALVYLGHRRYAILWKKTPTPTDDPEKGGKNTSTCGKGRGCRTSTKPNTQQKITCRKTGKKGSSISTPSKHPTSLSERCREKYGIGSGAIVDPEKYGRGKRSASKNIDYLKLNEGLDRIDDTTTSPKRPKITSHIPVRSGPTPQRQIAQKQVTVNPTVTTISTVKSKKDSNIPTDDALIGVPTTVSITDGTSLNDAHRGLGVTDAFFGVPDSVDSNILPDLGQSKDITEEDILNQMPAPVLDAGSTEEELDAADTLLSLSTVRDSTGLGFDDFEDNSLLMPIGGQPPIEDIAPEQLRLGQVEVDNEIAKIITVEEQERLANEDTGPVLSVHDNVGTEPPVVDPGNKTDTVENIENNNGIAALEVEEKDDEHVHKGARPKTPASKPDESEVVTKKGSRGAFRSQLYGLKRRSPKDRSYRCQICGTTKRSTESLNAHHRKRHPALNCTVCGKTFTLATFLMHHMYSHFPRKFYCDRCDFHCHFQSELDSHKITHRENPSYQCMYPKCGRWFKRKGELTLHIETHRKTWYDCRKCDFSTHLVKYLKEHEKSHEKELPYSCDLCGE